MYVLRKRKKNERGNGGMTEHDSREKETARDERDRERAEKFQSLRVKPAIYHSV